MSFQAPWWLLGLLAVVALVALYVLLQLRRKAYAARFTNVALLGTLVPRRPGWRRHLAFALVALGLAALVVSLAVPSTEVRVPRETATVVLALDVDRVDRPDARPADPHLVAAHEVRRARRRQLELVGGDERQPLVGVVGQEERHDDDEHGRRPDQHGIGGDAAAAPHRGSVPNR